MALLSFVGPHRIVLPAGDAKASATAAADLGAAVAFQGQAGASASAQAGLTTSVRLAGAAAAAASGSAALAVPSGGNVATFKLNPQLTGTLPYSIGIYPLEGAVPAGSVLISSDDSTVRSTVLSTWADGSAKVVVVAGDAAVVAGVQRTIGLQIGSQPGLNLDTSRIAAVVSNVTVNCGALGAASLSSFASPTLVWWVNPRVICAQYRVPVGSDPSLEAVIYIHAYAAPQNRARVQVVLENGKLNVASPTTPANKTYTATVTVNGSQIASVNSNSNLRGTHGAWMAWCAETWVGGNPLLEPTHDTAGMQAHPLFWKPLLPSTRDYSTFLPAAAAPIVGNVSFNGTQQPYGSDAYVPWSYGRYRNSEMGTGGDHPHIGPLPLWEATYLQTGDKFVRRAVVANAMSVLSYRLNTRSTATGLVPNFTEMGSKNRQDGSWPVGPQDGSNLSWGGFSGSGEEAAHNPAVGLMAFMCDPSPIFVELAQKAAVSQWALGSPFYQIAEGGSYGRYYQTRGKAWGIRNHAHATFLTPDSHAWKAPAVTQLGLFNTTLAQYRNYSLNPLGLVFDYYPGYIFDHDSPSVNTDIAGFQQAIWQHTWLAVECHKIDRAKLLSGAAATTFASHADWLCAKDVRIVSESIAGEWRVNYNHHTCGRVGELAGGVLATIDSLPTWSQQFAWQYPTDVPPSRTGPWRFGLPSDTLYSQAIDENAAYGGGFSVYSAIKYAGIAIGRERNVPGSGEAMSLVQSAITNYATWAASFADNPQYAVDPRVSAPTFALPAAGQAVQMPTFADNSHLATSAFPAGILVGEAITACFEMYGGGAFCEQFSDFGAWATVQNGGHFGQSNYFALIFDFTTGKWSRRDNAHGIPNTRTSSMTLAEVDNDGIVIASSPQTMPGPQHIYRQLVYLPPQAASGIGSKGVLVVTTGFGTENAGVKPSRFAHAFDMATGLWSKLTTNRWTDLVGIQDSFSSVTIENSCEWDPVAKRVYAFPTWPGQSGNATAFAYIDLVSGTWKAQAESITAPGYTTQNLFIDRARGLLLMQATVDSGGNGADALWGVAMTGPGFTPTGNAVQLISSGMPTNAQNRWAKNPIDGCWYYYNGDGSNTLYKITPPTGQRPGSLAGTWTCTQVTVAPQGFTMPARSATQSTNNHYSRFFWVPALKCFAWIASATARVVLLSPPSS